MKPHLVVAGNGMAGMRVVETLCRLVPDNFHITVIGREPRENYNRILLSPVLGGEKTFDQTVLHPREWYRDHHVRLLTDETITSIDAGRRTLMTSARELSWQQLVLATGSRPVMPPVPGIDLPHVCGFRTLDDVQHMLAVDGPVVVLGGGLLGIEAAAALRRRGRQVTLVHLMDRLMERQLDAVAARALLDSLNERGIDCRLNTTLARIDADNVLTSQGERLPAMRVVIAIGVAPEAGLAQAAGLACGRGIITDGQLRTSDAAISAVGECCEIDGNTFGLLAPCLAQAEVLAQRLAGRPVADFQLTDAGTRLKVTGIEVFSAGDIDPLPGDALYSAQDPDTGHYRRLLVRDQRLTGVLLYGDTTHAGGYLQRMQDATPVDSDLLFSPDNLQAPRAAAGRQTMSKPTLVVIGHGMVGQHFLEQMAREGLAALYHIVVFGDEPVEAYDRVHLTDYFAGRDAQALSLVKPGFMAEHGIDLRTGSRIVAIDRKRRCVRDDAGHETAYDRLIIATGSQAFVPPIPGHDSDGCFVYRTLADLDAIAARAKNARRGVVIGGGLLGLEAANALRKLGLETHVVEFAPRLMAVQLDDGGARLLRDKIEQLGVRVHTGAVTRQIAPGQDGGLRLNFADGDTLDTDLVVFSAGIRPRDQLARDSGLALGERGGILIDDRCQTSDPAIGAIGECAAWHGQLFGLVAPGYHMARVAASGLTGEQMLFTGADMSTKLKLLGVDVASIGDALGETAGCQSYTWSDGPAQVYKKLVVSEDGQRLLGAVLVGDCADYATLLQYKLNAMALPASPQSLILPARSGDETKALGVAALPDSAQICSCLNVSKADIRAAVRAGATDMAALKAATGAATGCGGCAALVKQVMNYQLAEQGVAISKDICEHFPWSRQALYDLIRVNQIRSFDALIEQYGKGHGCEVCKPLVGSLLASCWNEYILDPRHLPLQDTNDRYLANMQKDGTYSVVPRIAAGEITPAGLIAIGEVAQEFNLYSKITGGQRIDLFGARLEQLPAIWRRLIDAGFETGHAYGKSLRTVKSCVGSTWCRYGVQDSTALAIALEDRYKGLRSPHKIKMAVSGCTRECAEAQSKDIGVIATEKGWNLYVCGNGGMKPRHADLFASDLDRDTLIRTIDRVLMFYIRTADRLQRTSSWLDNMEGGLAYLQDVILHDSLGLAGTLEQEMAQVVASYQCEWRTTLQQADRLALFRPTVNSDRPDDNIQWQSERGQIRPAAAPAPAPLPPLPAHARWHELCRLEAIPQGAGIAARLEGRQIALFRQGDCVYALDNLEPDTTANVLARGILGDVAGEPVVISPLYKQRLRLRDGVCVDDPRVKVNAWPVRIEAGHVRVATRPQTVADVEPEAV